RGREMVGKRVDDQVAGAESACEETARRAPPVGAAALGIVDRPGRDEKLGELLQRRGVQAAERRQRLLQLVEIALSGDRKPGERFAALDLVRLDVLQDARPA